MNPLIRTKKTAKAELDAFNKYTGIKFKQVPYEYITGGIDDPGVTLAVGQAWAYLQTNNGQYLYKDTAITWLLKGAHKGCLRSQYTLGRIYCLHPDIESRDYVEGIKWFTKCAKRNLTSAQFLLAYFLYLTNDCKMNAKASHWLTEAVKSKNILAEDMLKALTLGIPVDLDRYLTFHN